MKSLEETIIPNKSKKKTVQKKTLADNGQTFLDVSKGDIRITKNGAAGGGLSENETNLNEKGYWITGTTTQYNIIVSEGVTTNITMENLSVTSGTSKERLDSMNVSHADVTVTLRGKNHLICNTAGTVEGNPPGTGCALAKDGMDGSLTIQCEHAGDAGHICDNQCGTLNVKGNADIIHAGALGSTYRNISVKKDSGFANLTIRGGNIDVSGGAHCPGIGSACVSERSAGGYTKDIRITGGNVRAVGTAYGAGIGSGFGNKVDGIYISGGYVEAIGGANAPGIGASGYASGYTGQSATAANIKISGGDTVVVAIGDEGTGMPGIGSAKGKTNVSNVTAAPDNGFQGYIQDGTSLTDYTFVEGTPFKTETAVDVNKFYTKVYFGGFRDTNEIQKDSKEQIGANHVISKSGGDAFTKDQLKGLTKVTGKQENGTDFSEEALSFEDEKQIEAINEAKMKGKTGEFPLTFSTPNGTKTTVTVYLKEEGSDAAILDPKHLESTIGADNFTRETGGNAFTAEDVRDLAGVKGKDSNGTTYDIADFKVNENELDAINAAKVKGKAGKFPLTFTSDDEKQVVITVTLFGEYDEIATDAASGEVIKANNVISKTGGDDFTEDQLKEISMVKALAGDNSEIDASLIIFPKQEEIQTINKAKTEGEIGEYPLTFETPDGTQVTVTVYLREDGTNGTEWTKGDPSLGANDAVHPTGGEGFSLEKLAEICGAKGKDENGDNASLIVDENQLKQLNGAKKKAKTGTFDITFLLQDGTKTMVKVTLTGEHKVSFDPDGGDYQPKDQTVPGGRTAVEPKEPKKEGYIFEGWYYTDEEGNETLWDFDTLVNENILLKAKWREVVKETEKATKTTEKTSKEKPEKKETKSTKDTKKSKDYWDYREVRKRKNNAVAKTGDRSIIWWMFGSAAALAGMAVIFASRKKEQNK